ncbi:protein kinase family protein [Desulfotignum phosphitoxidans]|uniref:Uncharacterized protein n=1 Tax=Desulfotignum phosphitoxidans DSM 13687 TaxID=1286635 RepID=S0G7B2_9BACT|nr:hypothetical protein [Desulfotignum phosphitoxidans]EMS80716.1 hypothetical protein Dpo_2c04120 [Desulfotignum phosphitoxidans DSM 13687]
MLQRMNYLHVYTRPLRNHPFSDGMAEKITQIPVSSIILDESIYPRKAVGRSRQTVDAYIADLRAVTLMGRDIKIFCMHHLGMPQERMAQRLGLDQKTIHRHLGKMPIRAFCLNDDLSRGFTVAQVAEKHGWPEPLVWSLALEGKNDHDRFKALGWGFRTWSSLIRPIMTKKQAIMMRTAFPGCPETIIWIFWRRFLPE